MITHRTRDNRTDPYEVLSIIEKFPNCVAVQYKPSAKDIEMAMLPEEEAKQARNFTHELMMINGQDDFISIYPLNTLPGQAQFLTPKYNQVKSITLDEFEFDVPGSIEDLLYLLEYLPAGFVKNYEYGLGLQKDYRFIVHSIEKIPGVEHLIISFTDDTKVKDDSYILSYSDFDGIRKGINRITKKHQSEGMIEKNIFSHNVLLHSLNPEKYDELKKPYKKDSIYKFISSTTIESAELSRTDAEVVVDVISKNKYSIYKQEKGKILQLQHDIETICFESLISEIENLISKKATEPKCQILLNENQFVLSLAFGYPVVKVQDQASVGGHKLSGSGDKITDFLVKNNLTCNTALIEIKRPGTPLLRKSEYRNGVYGPSKELTEAVVQILDQKYKFQTEISMIKINSELYDIETYSVDCVLIIGSIPSDRSQKKCFELYRNNLKDVRIYTFDELLNKLKDIYLAITQTPADRRLE